MFLKNRNKVALSQMFFFQRTKVKEKHVIQTEHWTASFHLVLFRIVIRRKQRNSNVMFMLKLVSPKAILCEEKYFNICQRSQSRGDGGSNRRKSLRRTLNETN